MLDNTSWEPLNHTTVSQNSDCALQLEHIIECHLYLNKAFEASCPSENTGHLFQVHLGKRDVNKHRLCS